MWAVVAAAVAVLAAVGAVAVALVVVLAAVVDSAVAAAVSAAAALREDGNGKQQHMGTFMATLVPSALARRALFTHRRTATAE